MMSKLRMIGLAGMVSFGLAGSLSASVMLTVNATDDIFAAGLGSDPGGGALPASLSFIPVAGNILTFQGPGIALGSAVTGTVSPCPSCGSVGPDGGNLGSQAPATNISGTTNLSPIQYTGNEMFLIGVFLGASLPGSAVASIGQYGATGNTVSPTAASFSPLVGQTFFIGDGLTGTGSGSIQQFVVPTGATQLFLGFADAMSFSGTAGMYSDNTGSLNVNLQIEPASAAPEPGTLALFALGFAGLVLGRKKLLA